MKKIWHILFFGWLICLAVIFPPIIIIYAIAIWYILVFR